MAESKRRNLEYHRQQTMNEPGIQFYITNDPIFAENGYIVYRRDDGPCWIIDPGLPPQAERIIAFVREHSLKPEAVILTHAHGDHIAGVDDVLAGLGDLPVHLAEEEWPMLADPAKNLSSGIGMPVSVSAKDVRDLPVGQVLELDGSRWVIGDVAGHSPAGRSLYCAEEGVVIVGDALFAGSVGRVDFPHSDGPTLMANIRNTLMTLPDDTRVLSGHGPETTIGLERTTNPFVLHGL